LLVFAAVDKKHRISGFSFDPTDVALAKVNPIENLCDTHRASLAVNMFACRNGTFSETLNLRPPGNAYNNLCTYKSFFPRELGSVMQPWQTVAAPGVCKWPTLDVESRQVGQSDLSLAGSVLHWESHDNCQYGGRCAILVTGAFGAFEGHDPIMGV
jgi:hypothetical protein